jgi:GGDEF domain-containing protein
MRWSVLTSQVASDVVARVGGDEFIILLVKFPMHARLRQSHEKSIPPWSNR